MRVLWLLLWANERQQLDINEISKGAYNQVGLSFQYNSEKFCAITVANGTM